MGGGGASEPSVFFFCFVLAFNVFIFAHGVRLVNCHRPCGCCLETQLGVHRMVLSWETMKGWVAVWTNTSLG
uniref:Putative secreted protein n=1 Tax=Ixodes ricinus TaxID=34613 RepID=A0A6B0TUF2_IXORI